MRERRLSIFSWLLLGVVLLALTPDFAASAADIAEENRVEESAASPFDTEDENSDINLKFLPHEFALQGNATHAFLRAAGDLLPAEHIEEILTPPPLSR